MSGLFADRMDTVHRSFINSEGARIEEGVVRLARAIDMLLAEGR